MAKAEGPLFALEASGKIGGTISFVRRRFSSVVRKVTTPTNTKTATRGDERFLQGGISKALSFIEVESVFYYELLKGGFTKHHWHKEAISSIKIFILPDIDAFIELYNEFADHNYASKFDSEADRIGMKAFDIEYKSIPYKFLAGLQLYLLAKFAIYLHSGDPTLFNFLPYTKNILDWDETDIASHTEYLLAD
jgi:hypothetical protein